MAEEEERLAEGGDQTGVHLGRENLWRTGRDTQLVKAEELFSLFQTEYKYEQGKHLEHLMIADCSK